MIDKAAVIDGLCAIRRFFEISQPSQAIIFDSYQNIIDGAIELIHDQQGQIAMLVVAQHELCEMMKEQEAEIRQLKLALDIAKGTCKGISVEGR